MYLVILTFQKVAIYFKRIPTAVVVDIHLDKSKAIFFASQCAFYGKFHIIGLHIVGVLVAYGIKHSLCAFKHIHKRLAAVVGGVIVAPHHIVALALYCGKQ